jgi:hypothetical protein
LLAFLNDYGMQLMAGELVLLAIATFAAMGIDQARTTRSARSAVAETGRAGSGGEPNKNPPSCEGGE